MNLFVIRLSVCPQLLASFSQKRVDLFVHTNKVFLTLMEPSCCPEVMKFGKKRGLIAQTQENIQKLKRVLETYMNSITLKSQRRGAIRIFDNWSRQ